MRDPNTSLFSILQNEIDKLTLKQRLGTTISFPVVEKSAARNIEIYYQNSIKRLAELSYYYSWGCIFENDSELDPFSESKQGKSYVKHRYQPTEINKVKQRKILNTSFSGWINNNVIRDLSEFFMFYLLGVYETCVIAKYANKDLTLANVVNGKEDRDAFEKHGMKDRLGILRKEFGINITHNQQLISVYELRNVFSHYDGVVQSKFCKDNEKLKVLWPKSTYKLKKTGSDKWVHFHKVRIPFSSDEYEEMRVEWLAQSHVNTYVAGDVIKLTVEEINDLISFYQYVINETQQQLVDYFKSHGFKAKDFKKYSSKPVFKAVDENGKYFEMKYLDIS